MSPGPVSTSNLPPAELVAKARVGMRRMAQSVCIISAADPKGGRHAMTATSVTSVSMDPPALLVCVHRDASLHPLLVAGLPFCVNVLSAGMEAISQRCAGPEREERFSIGDWRTHEASGLPYLADAEANFFCGPPVGLQYGTHLVCVGRLTDACVRQGDPTPLVYLDGRYR